MSSRIRGHQTRDLNHVSPSKYRSGYALGTIRPAVLLLAKTLFIPLASAAPFSLIHRSVNVFEDDGPQSPSDPSLWINLGVAVVLVLLGGAFAGLTIALMGQDETYLQVIATSGEGSERRHAEKVLGLLNRGKHWVLVTLLLSNVITNETLPIVLDASLGGGWPAVLGSTVAIVIFGEIVPQSICVRYGLAIGAFMSPVVLGLMYIEFPVAWPTAKLLDYLLGADHGTMYKKAGLKTLVQLHKSLGTTAGERLMEDEVTIINSVLDLKEKPVGDIMTPMQDVFTMSADTVLDERMMDTILSQGYSRIPIYAPDNKGNFIGMLLVKILITYDPEDATRVHNFSLATLPETAPFTSCLDIINFFQEGKSHMVLVSDFPGQNKGALGVVTLEDVIEELIGEEIIDESDVFIDVHKAIRRMAPAPKQKVRGHGGLEPSRTKESEHEAKEDEPLLAKESPRSRQQSFQNGNANANGPPGTFLVRRKSSTASTHSLKDAAAGPKDYTVPVRTNTAELREHLKHLGPSNVATRPRATKYQSVKIKPGVGTIPENQQTTIGIGGTGIAGAGDRLDLQRTLSVGAQPTPAGAGPNIPEGGGDPELHVPAAKGASGGAAALRAGYGTMSSSPERKRRGSDGVDVTNLSPSDASKIAEQKARQSQGSPTPEPAYRSSRLLSAFEESRADSDPPQRPSSSSAERERPSSSASEWGKPKMPGKLIVGSTGAEDEEGDDVGDMQAPSGQQRKESRRTARSGSITETTVDVGGMKKTVLEPGSSPSESDEEDGDGKPEKKGSGSSKDSR